MAALRIMRCETCPMMDVGTEPGAVATGCCHSTRQSARSANRATHQIEWWAPVATAPGSVPEGTPDVRGLQTNVTSFTPDAEGLQENVTSFTPDARGLQTNVTSLRPDVRGLQTNVTSFTPDAEGFAIDLVRCWSSVPEGPNVYSMPTHPTSTLRRTEIVFRHRIAHFAPLERDSPFPQLVYKHFAALRRGRIYV